MKVQFSQEDGGIRLLFTPSPQDPLKAGKVSFVSKDASIKTDIKISNLHPDILGLIALLIAGQFSSDIELDRPVSPQFSEAAQSYRGGLGFGPSSSGVFPRLRPKKWVPSLCFSGGVDSYAALQLMPKNTECYFLSSPSMKNGIKHPKEFMSGRRAIEYVRTFGHFSVDVESDLEFVRSKPGLPDDLACAVPVLLFADERNIGSVSFGSIAEAAYRTGSTAYIELEKRPAYQKIHSIFEAVDLPVHNVVVGLSEVLTTRIISAAGLADRTQSCMWGGEVPCGECIKCVRKSLLLMAINGDWPPPDIIRRMMSRGTAARRLKETPNKLENVFAYIAFKYPRNDEFGRIWKAAYRADQLDMSWMEKVFPSSLNFMVDELRPLAVSKLAECCEFMTLIDLENASKFRLHDLLEDKKAMASRNLFLDSLE